MSDLIDRDKAIDVLDDFQSDIENCVTDAYAIARQRMTAIPSARPQGEWIVERLDNYKKVKYTCPFCKWYGIDNYDGYVDVIDFDFCPNCGADMTEREGE